MSGRYTGRTVAQKGREFLCDTKMMYVVEDSLTLQSTHTVLEEEASPDCLLKCPHFAAALTSSPSCTEMLCIPELCSSRVLAQAASW